MQRFVRMKKSCSERPDCIAPLISSQSFRLTASESEYIVIYWGLYRKLQSKWITNKCGTNPSSDGGEKWQTITTVWNHLRLFHTHHLKSSRFPQPFEHCVFYEWVRLICSKSLDMFVQDICTGSFSLISMDEIHSSLSAVLEKMWKVSGVYSSNCFRCYKLYFIFRNSFRIGIKSPWVSHFNSEPSRRRDKTNAHDAKIWSKSIQSKWLKWFRW